MSLYFVDFHDGEDLYYDAEGSEFENFELVCKQAILSLKEIAKDRPKNDKFRAVTVIVRGETESTLYKATLILYNKRCSVTILTNGSVHSGHFSNPRLAQGNVETLPKPFH
jgi:hypothetical protein